LRNLHRTRELSARRPFNGHCGCLREDRRAAVATFVEAARQELAIV
jgi:hypothetical protein